MRGEIFNTENTVQPATQAGMSVQNPYCVRYAVNGEMMARQGAMVAYRGNLQIQTKSQGIGKLLKRAVTGEGVALMSVQGQGEIWLADEAKSVFVLGLEQGDNVTVNGKSVLAFDPTLNYDIRMVKGAGMTGGGLFNCVFDGQGSLAVTAHGTPMVIPVTPEVPVLVDTEAVIAWSSALQTSIHRSEGVKSLLKGGSGELFQLVLQGQGFVVVQPSEGPTVPTSNGSSGGGGIGDLFGDS